MLPEINSPRFFLFEESVQMQREYEIIQTIANEVGGSFNISESLGMLKNSLLLFHNNIITIFFNKEGLPDVSVPTISVKCEL